VNSGVDRLIRAAIEKRRLLEFTYDRHLRLAEPHDYGIHKGARKLLCYQVGGHSGSGKVPDWRTFMVDKIADANVTDTSFSGSRNVPGKHIVWERIFASVSR
jgi:predicted DNA-binding transcriptional regulator YafY